MFRQHLLFGLWVVAFLARSVAATRSEIVIDPWKIPDNGVPYPKETASVGDKITFIWFVPGLTYAEQPNFSVNIHPSGTCDEEGKQVIGDGPLPAASYIFTDADAGKDIFFACNAGTNCAQGMQVTVKVRGPVITTPADSIQTVNPTERPTNRPTARPTDRPTLRPTDRPTPRPTNRPTQRPTNRPTNRPTPRPTNRPTPRPTRRPTDRPTDMPTPRPSLGPSKTPTLPPSTLAPVDLGGGIIGREETFSPTLQDEELHNQVDVVATVVYTVLVRSGELENIPFTTYEDLLTYSIFTLAVQVAEEVFGEQGRRMQEDGTQETTNSTATDTMISLEGVSARVNELVAARPIRTLGFTPDPQATSEGAFAGEECPSESGSAGVDRCELISTSVGLFLEVPQDTDPEAVKEVFRDVLLEAVLEGRLQSILLEAYPAAKIVILTGQSLPIILPPIDGSLEDDQGDSPDDIDRSNGSSDSDKGSNKGPLIAIGIGLFAIVAIASATFIILSRRRNGAGAQAIAGTGGSVGKDSTEAKTLDATGLEWGDAEESGSKAENDDATEGSRPAMIDISGFSKYGGNIENQSMPDNASYISGDDIVDYSSQSISSKASSFGSAKASLGGSIPTISLAAVSKLEADSIMKPYMIAMREVPPPMSDTDVFSQASLDFSYNFSKNSSIGGGSHSSTEASLDGDRVVLRDEYDVADVAYNFVDGSGSQAGSQDSQSIGNASRNSGSTKYTNSSQASTASSASVFGGNRVIDLGGGGRNLREYTPGIATLDDLEAAVLAGDWGALGTTASHLAERQYDSESDVQSLVSNPVSSVAGDSTDAYSLQSNYQNHHHKAWEDVIDATKAAELDQLISTGNWAALMETANRYEEQAKMARRESKQAAAAAARDKDAETTLESTPAPSQVGVSHYAEF